MRRILDIAISQINQQEQPIGSNWGEPVKTYLHSVGIDFPASWCMAFVYWCAEQAGISHHLIKTGGVLHQWDEIDPTRKMKMPQPGSVFIMDFGHGLGHTGLVERVEGDTLYTIEGNTNDTGSREGYRVCRKVRKISSMKGFISLS